MKYKIGDKVRVRIDLVPCERYGSLTFLDGNMSKCAGQICTIMKVLSDEKYYVSENPFAWSEEMLEPVTPTLAEIKEKKLTCVIHTPNKEDAICIVDEIPSSDSSTARNERLSYWDFYRENTCYKIIDGMINAYCDKQFYEEKGYLIYEFSNLVATAESISHITGIPYENSINKLKTCLGTFPNDGISAKNGGKNSMKFTFYTEEGYRIDKSNNTRIPTMTTEVLINGKDYQYGGSATCDKTDYEEREGVLNAIANAVCGGNFDREFNKVMKNKAFANKKSRTCTYCGQVFDTVEEKREHEAWHVECKKARRERYLLRKRAREIAFEEQAQKLAKEMMK